MTAPSAFQRLRAAIDRWFTAPEPNAAGRLGLFRMVFSAFYLWHLSSRLGANLSGIPAQHRYRLFLVDWLPDGLLTPGFFELLEALLVAALVLLMVGYAVNLATAAVLVLGSVYEAFFISVGFEHSTVLLVFYIPFFMLLGGSWGASYSLDGLLRRRRGGVHIDPSDPGWPYYFPARAVLVALAALFITAVAWKLVPGETFLSKPDLFGNIVLTRNIRAALLDLPMNPLAPAIAQTPLAEIGSRYIVILVEGGFVLALINRKWRSFIVAQMLIFHAMNGIWLVVSFTPVLVVYGLFIDWQAIRVRVWPRRVTLLDRVSSGVLIGTALTAALGAGLLWNSGPGWRAVWNLGGLVTWHTVWYPILPVVIVWWLVALRDLLRRYVPMRGEVGLRSN